MHNNNSGSQEPGKFWPVYLAYLAMFAIAAVIGHITVPHNLVGILVVMVVSVLATFGFFAAGVFCGPSSSMSGGGPPVAIFMVLIPPGIAAFANMAILARFAGHDSSGAVMMIQFLGVVVAGAAITLASKLNDRLQNRQ